MPKINSSICSEIRNYRNSKYEITWELFNNNIVQTKEKMHSIPGSKTQNQARFPVKKIGLEILRQINAVLLGENVQVEKKMINT